MFLGEKKSCCKSHITNLWFKKKNRSFRVRGVFEATDVNIRQGVAGQSAELDDVVPMVPLAADSIKTKQGPLMVVLDEIVQ